MHHLPDAFIAMKNKYRDANALVMTTRKEKRSVDISHVTVDRNEMSGLRKCGWQSSRLVQWEVQVECKLRTVTVPGFTRYMT